MRMFVHRILAALIVAVCAAQSAPAGAQTATRLGFVSNLTFDPSGTLHILDSVQSGVDALASIRKISSSGVVTTIRSGITGNPNSLAVDGAGNSYFTNSDVAGSVFKVDPSGALEYFLSGRRRLVAALHAERRGRSRVGTAVCQRYDRYLDHYSRGRRDAIRGRRRQPWW